MRIPVLCFLLNLCLCSSLNKDQLAEITFNDQTGKLHTLHLQYFIDSQRLQYGVKFAITVHFLAIQNCKLQTSGFTEEYFAAYIVIPENCNALNLIKDCETHGASFVFVDSHLSSNSPSKLMSNTYNVPVFFLSHSEDPFSFQALTVKQLYLSIFFLMVC